MDEPTEQSSKIDKRKATSKANIQKALEARKKKYIEQQKMKSMFEDSSSSESDDSYDEVVYIQPKRKPRAKKDVWKKELEAEKKTEQASKAPKSKKTIKDGDDTTPIHSNSEIEMLKKELEALRSQIVKPPSDPIPIPGNITKPQQSGNGNSQLKEAQKRVVYRLLDFD